MRFLAPRVAAGRDAASMIHACSFARAGITGRTLGCAALLAVAGAARIDAQSATESSVIACERSWHASLANGDTEAIYRCLADDFPAIAPDGKSYDRRAVIADAARTPRMYMAAEDVQAPLAP